MATLSRCDEIKRGNIVEVWCDVVSVATLLRCDEISVLIHHPHHHFLESAQERASNSLVSILGLNYAII